MLQRPTGWPGFQELGAALLSALEKRDAEALSLLLSGARSCVLLEAVREVRVKQIEEAESAIEGCRRAGSWFRPARLLREPGVHE